MTIPSLIQDYREKAYIVQLKKVYSTLSIINQSVISEYGENYGCRYCVYNSDNAPSYVQFKNEITEKWLPYLDIAKKCTSSNRIGCFANKAYDGINRKAYGYLNSGDAYLLKDGTAIMFVISGNTGFEIITDLNGPKGPNKFGVDTFHFGSGHHLQRPWINGKILPYGSPVTGYNFAPHNLPCKRTVSSSFQIMTCGAWVLEYENMDYLHCDDLERGVKTKCK